MALGKKSKIVIISAVVAVLVLTAVTLAVVFLTGKEENKWIPAVQGSHVDEIEYEDLESMQAFAYDDFKTFEKSAFADMYIIQQRPAKEERYSEEYFAENNLVIIKFNFEYKGAEFYVKDIAFKAGSLNVVTLIGMVDQSQDVKQESTYCCYLETAKEVTGVTYGLEIMQIDYVGFEQMMIGKDNLPIVPQEGAIPAAYKIDAVAGIAEFAACDGTLSEVNVIMTYLNNKYDDEFFANESLLLVKVPSSDFITNYASTDEYGKLTVTSVRSNHYKYLKETKYYSLIILSVAKDFSLTQTQRIIYNEYEDDLPSVASDSEYAVAEDFQNSTDNLSVYVFTAMAD